MSTIIIKRGSSIRRINTKVRLSKKDLIKMVLDIDPYLKKNTSK